MNSSLVSYTRLSPNNSGKRRYDISRITPHYVGGNATVETLGEIFAPVSRQASSNYGIGSDGRVGMYVEESNRAWTSGSSDNDNRAVTIECANLSDGSLTDAAWKTLVELCADICRRNGKSRIVYTGDVSNVNDDEMLLTKHKWFQSTDCPGPWLDNQFERLANEVNAKLGDEATQLTYPQESVEVMWHYINHDASHGYSQPHRDGDGGTEELVLSDGTKVTIPTGDVDCSKLVQNCYTVIGVLPTGIHMWTGDEREILLANGFVEVGLDEVSAGDVLWVEGHTELYLGDGMQGGARRSEYHSIDGQTGDQDGGEVTSSKYVISQWTSAYRCTKVRPKTEERSDGMLACIVDIKDDHRGYKKGMQVLWTAEAGFEYINHPDSIVLLDKMSRYYTGKPMLRVESSEKAPWVLRLAQITVNDKTDGMVK